MDNGEMDTKRAKGPFAYENWRAAQAGLPVSGAFEHPLFTDAHIVGQLDQGYGPYQLLNAVPHETVRYSRPTLILRVEYHLENDLTPMDKTDVDRYHGGTLPDEIAALVSLCLGIRLKAGDATRVFGWDDDPRGRPLHLGANPDPLLPKVSDKPVVPGLLGTHSLEDAAILSQLAILSPKEAIALVRAARLYQEAMWIVEATPELSWIMLTSAIETAANAWRMATEPALDRLRTSRPNLEKLLRDKGGEELVLQVAEEIAPYMGSTKKFIDFILNFLPSPPAVRPVEYYQFRWTDKAMKEAMKQIYGHRSRALHGGIPFPASMCRPSIHRDENDVLSEVPTMYAMSTRGGVWLTKDAPVTLHTFEYIARHALLNWWKSLVRTKLHDSTVRDGTV